MKCAKSPHVVDQAHEADAHFGAGQTDATRGLAAHAFTMNPAAVALGFEGCFGGFVAVSAIGSNGTAGVAAVE